jgi:hypothetical protein
MSIPKVSPSQVVLKPSFSAAEKPAQDDDPIQLIKSD